MVLLRTLAYATLFVSLVLVLLPSQILRWFGVTRPAGAGVQEAVGIAVVVLGAALALWCILTFALVGRGTPAPFDPPRRLVMVGPYRFVRNPMYIGAGTALMGAAIIYRSMALIGFVALFLLVTHIFVVSYEEPTLRRIFGDEYESYRRRVRRWLPRW